MPESDKVEDRLRPQHTSRRAPGPVRQGKAASNGMPVHVRLEADCLIGDWADHARQARKIHERAGIKEGLNALAAAMYRPGPSPMATRSDGSAGSAAASTTRGSKSVTPSPLAERHLPACGTPLAGRRGTYRARMPAGEAKE